MIDDFGRPYDPEIIPQVSPAPPADTLPEIVVTAPRPAVQPAPRPTINRATIPASDPSADPPPDEPQTRADLIASIEKHRRPRAYVRVGGMATVVPISVEVVNNNYYAADTFHLTFAISSLPAEVGPAFWASAVPIQIEVFLGFIPPGGTTPDWQSVILGNVDEPEIHWDQNQIIIRAGTARQSSLKPSLCRTPTRT